MPRALAYLVVLAAASLAACERRPSAEAGEEIFRSKCAGCHATTTARRNGPGLQGVTTRISDPEVDAVLERGRGAMLPAQALGLTAEDLASLKAYLRTL